MVEMRTESGIGFTVIDDLNASSDWLVLVHALSHGQRFFDAQVSAFRSQFRLLIVDLRGHGASADAPGPYGFEEYADDVLAAVDSAGIDKMHYWGSHTGAAVGLIALLRRPELFESLVLEGGFANDLPMPDVFETVSRSAALARSKGVQAGLDYWFDHGAWFDHIRASPDPERVASHRALVEGFGAAPWTTDLKSRVGTPMADKLDQVSQPVLLVNGEFDSPEFLDASKDLASRLPTSSSVIIAGTGGFPSWEGPLDVNRAATEFLAGVSAGAPPKDPGTL